jgi:hypothetical protein
VSNHFFSFLFRHEFGQEKKYRTPPPPTCFFFGCSFSGKIIITKLMAAGSVSRLRNGDTTKTRVDFAFFLSQLLVGGVCVSPDGRRRTHLFLLSVVRDVILIKSLVVLLFFVVVPSLERKIVVWTFYLYFAALRELYYCT